MEVNAGNAKIGENKVNAGTISIPVMRGNDGKNATIEIGIVETINPEEMAEVINSGTDMNVILNFKIPKGKDGKEYDDTEIRNLIENTINSLQNYYLKTETLSTEEIYSLISNLDTVKLLKVDSLPEVGETNVIYLLPKEASENNVFQEYIYVNDSWEMIGSTAINLEEYAKIDFVEEKTQVNRSVITTESEISENTDYTIPLKYQVGNNSLDIFYMGEKLVKDEHYIEVGETGNISTIIQFFDWGQAVPTDRIIEFIVRGVEQ